MKRLLQGALIAAILSAPLGGEVLPPPRPPWLASFMAMPTWDGNARHNRVLAVTVTLSPPESKAKGIAVVEAVVNPFGTVVSARVINSPSATVSETALNLVLFHVFPATLKRPGGPDVISVSVR